MRIISFRGKIIFVLLLFLIFGGCEETPDPDVCLKTKWLQKKEYEIKLAVKVSDSNPDLPGGTAGSLNPVDFEKICISGNIQKVYCSEQKDSLCSLGNSYITKGIDLTIPVDEPDAYWIGHVVYVYEFGNAKERLNINLTVKVTMMDGQSYVCNMSDKIYPEQIVLVPGELYYYILLDIYSDLWIKV